MANEIANAIHAMVTFSPTLDGLGQPVLLVLNSVGVKKARLFMDNIDPTQVIGIIFQLEVPCAFNVIPTQLPILTAPIPSAQLICTGYAAALASDGASPVAVIIPNDVPLDPLLGFQEDDHGAILYTFELANSTVPVALDGLGLWQLTVLDFPNYEGADNHGVVIPNAVLP